MKTILVADDVGENRYLLTALLKAHGYNVVVAADGAEALRLAQSAPPDAIVTDIMMPEMDGFELCRRWRQDDRLKRIPFVIYTATYTDPKDERLAMSLGADRFFIKPQQPDVILQAVRDVLDAANPKPGVISGDEMNLLQQHRDALMRKLEKKVAELETDIVRRRQAEAERGALQSQLLQAQKIESIGRLAGGVAHDFNNLLSVVLSYTEFALESVREGDPLRADLEEIRKAGERAAALTRQLLAFSRKQLLEPEVVSLNHVVSGIDQMLRRLLGEGIHIDMHLADDAGSVMADPGQLEQVIMNLAINARDAMPGGGRLTIETSNVELDEESAGQRVDVTPGRYVQLSMTDTGIGMDAELKSHIFEPFFTTKEKGKGTGLGLSTVYGIVKQSGGSVWVYSEVGRGTTFKIYLPRLDALPAAAPRKVGTAVAVGSETILLVEDEAAVRRIAERILRSAGYEVLAAAGGGEALLLCEKRGDTIDLLLTDVVMPQMGGPELVDRVRSICPRMKALYMSGYTDDTVVHASVLYPGTRFIGKPFTFDGLTRKVREVLDEGRRPARD